MRTAVILTFLLLISCAAPVWEQPPVLVGNGQEWTRSGSAAFAVAELPEPVQRLKPKKCLKATYVGAGGIDVIECDMGSASNAFEAMQKTAGSPGIYPVAEDRYFFLVQGSQEQRVISVFVDALRRKLTARQ